MPIARKGARLLGPFFIRERSKYRVVEVRPDGRRSSSTFDDEPTASEYIRRAETRVARLKETTVAQALQAYAKHLEKKGNLARTIDTTMIRLGSFFGPNAALRMSALTPKGCQEIFHGKIENGVVIEPGFETRPSRRQGDKKGKPSTGPAPSIDTQRNTLAEAKTFLRWAIKKEHLAYARGGNEKATPLDAIEIVGRRRRGKKQLSADEISSWFGKAFELAAAGESGAVAAMLTFALTLRASEVVALKVRDLDVKGTVLWVEKSKTEAGRRRNTIPEEIQPYLIALAKGRAGDELLFGKHWRDWPREWVQKICRGAKVPVITAHGMRGTHSTLAEEAGITGVLLMRAMGHRSITTTHRHYAQADAVAAGAQKRVFGVLRGGRSTPSEERTDSSEAFTNRFPCRGASI
jgi:integrase